LLPWDPVHPRTLALILAATLAAAAAHAASRPSWNTGKGFFVLNATVYDANGVEFRIRGLNHTHWWGSNNEAAIAEIAKAGPNTVRVVFGPDMGAQTTSEREAVVKQYVGLKIVPMVEYHSGTCKTDAASLESIVDLWVGPDAAWLKTHEREVMLNIANEWGPTDAGWRDAYKTAITRIRGAGINNLLVVDAGGCGQNIDTIINWGQEVFDHDPQRNVVLSIHMYGLWRDPGHADVGSWDGRQPYDIDAELKTVTGKGLPLIVGEFSWQEGNDVGYTTKTAIQTYEKHNVGWIAWSWNQNSDAKLDMVHGYQYSSAADLTPFGDLVINDSALGLATLAQTASIFTGVTDAGTPGTDGGVGPAEAGPAGDGSLPGPTSDGGGAPGTDAAPGAAAADALQGACSYGGTSAPATPVGLACLLVGLLALLSRRRRPR
jgi:mannan endo-1,4-beta-mannosidase